MWLMRFLLVLFLTVLFASVLFCQDDLGPMLAAENAFIRAARENGAKHAFLDHLSTDSVLFRPQAINGRQYWREQDGPAGEILVRKTIYADVSANGLLGYTTGNWRIYKKDKSEATAVFGQYVTIWQRREDGRYSATLDIAISHDKLPFLQTDHVGRVERTRDLNERGWSPADASIGFHRMSMTNVRLGGAYEEYAAKDVRLLVDREPPIVGKKNVVREMNRFIAAEFPTKVVAFQSADLAYTWNPCRFASNDEGLENGNCLHIWKLRDKKWRIVLGVFARFPNEKPPSLKRAS
jgi:ketosteroid isomerase-like protein